MCQNVGVVDMDLATIIRGEYGKISSFQANCSLYSTINIVPPLYHANLADYLPKGVIFFIEIFLVST